MKTKKRISLFGFIAVLAISSVLITSCNDEKEQNTEVDEQEQTIIDDEVITENLSSIEIKVEGMTCEGCENTITNAIMELDGINHSKVSHTEGNAVVEFDKTKTSKQEICDAISKTGYKVIP